MGDESAMAFENAVERDYWMRCTGTGAAPLQADAAVRALRARSAGIVERGERTYTIDEIVAAVRETIAPSLPNAPDLAGNIAVKAAYAAIKVMEGRR